MNYGIKIDLLKLKSAFITNLKGKSATKRCLVIAIDDSDLFIGEKGIYLNLAAFEMMEHKFADTHLLKVNISKEDYKALTEEERRNQPICGSMKPMVAVSAKELDVTSSLNVDDQNVDDMPF